MMGYVVSTCMYTVAKRNISQYIQEWWMK
jgi:hypothetical protein